MKRRNNDNYLGFAELFSDDFFSLNHSEFIATVPDELTIQSGFLQTPEGLTVLCLFPIYGGAIAAGEQVRELEELLVVRCRKLLQEHNLIKGLTCYHW